jgi:hypothetical protein
MVLKSFLEAISEKPFFLNAPNHLWTSALAIAPLCSYTKLQLKV